MTGFIRVVREAGIVSLFLNRPERRNALSLALLAELSEALSDEIREDTTAFIISGVNGFFSAGGDLSDMTGTPADLRIDDAIEEVTRKIQELPVPVIAAIDGPCMGGAFDLALSCDHRIAATDAFFQVPAARLGLLYNPRAIVRMRQRLGRDGVFRVLVLGERLDAAEARVAGVVSHVVEGPSHDAALKIARAAGGNVLDMGIEAERLLRRGEYRRAVEILQQALQLDPVSDWLHGLLGRAYVGLGNTGSALAMHRPRHGTP